MSKERELLKKVVVNHDSPYGWGLIEEIQNLLAQPETERLTLRQGVAENKKGYKRGYNAAVRDLKTKIELFQDSNKLKKISKDIYNFSEKEFTENKLKLSFERIIS